VGRPSLDALLAAAGLDPADGVQVAAGERVAALPVDPSLPLILLAGAERSEPAARDVGGAQTREGPPVLPGRHARRSTREVLAALYPHGHPARPLPDGEPRPIERLTDDDLRSGDWYLAPLPPLDNLASPHGMAAISARLRAPDGCPWDRRQTHASLRPFLLEEAYEAVDALDRGATGAELAEELGDLLLQVVLHAQLAAEEGAFDLTDVHRSIAAKIVRRHPHVFGDVVADSAAEVIRNWEQIKAGERAARSAGLPESTEADTSVPQAFAGLSMSLPALAYAQEMQERAASLGYDWPSIDGVLDKVTEEAREVIAATDERQRREEFGDLLMVLVNLARKTGIDAESALRGASAKFAARFANVERQAAARDVELRSLSMDELDELWQQAKRDTAQVGSAK
jgi:MazG family protein